MIMFSMLSLLFLFHCFLLFYCCFFSLYLPMPLLLHIVFCYYYHYCCMRVVVIINIVIRMVVVVIIIIIIIIIIVVVFIALLLPIQHLCFIPFYGLLISLSLSPHGTSVITYSIVLLYFTLFYRALSSYSFLRMRFSYEWYE